jgi:DNA-binding transcriptional regulator PaaX
MAPECFIRHFWITCDFGRLFPGKDPNLPRRLLPTNWIGLKARQLLRDYRQLLGPFANAHVDEVMGS